MAQPTLNQVAAEMQRSQWQDFCINDTHPSAKLTSADIADIFAARRAGRTQYAIAAMAGISQTHVSRILRGEGRR